MGRDSSLQERSWLCELIITAQLQTHILYAICCIISCRYIPVYLIALLFRIPYLFFLILSHISAFILSQPLLFKSFQDANIHWSMCLSFKVPPSSCLSPTFIKRTQSTSTQLMGSAPTRRSTRRTWTCSRYDIMYLLSQQISHVEGICVRPWSIRLWPFFISIRMVVLTHSNSSSCFCLHSWFFRIILVRQHH